MTAPLLHLRLAELLATRLCHDVASPLGAITGLIEMAEEADDRAALADARAAAARLADRLRLFRAAWAIDPGHLSPGALAALAAPLAADGRVRLDFSALLRQPDFAPQAGRVVLNLLMGAAESLNGVGSVHLSGCAGRDVLLRIDGPRAKWPAGLATCLAEPESAWDQLDDPRTLQMPLTVLLAAHAGLRLSMLMPTGAAAGTAPPLMFHLDT